MNDRRPELATEQHPLRVVAAILFDGQEVLACRRKLDGAAGGLWEFPGGKIEPGETPAAALIREIREKLDIAILVDDELSTDVTPVLNVSIELICLRARLKGARPIGSSDHDQLLWLRVADLDQLEWAAPYRPAVRRLIAADDSPRPADARVEQSELPATGETVPPLNTSTSWASSPGVRRSMLGNRARDTQPELAVRGILHRMGLRYRVDLRPTPRVRARGDIVFPRRRLVVFIDGCHWHGCPQHYTAPKSNTAYWSAKLAANRERDARTTDVLTELGWTVLRFWTHQDSAEIAEEIRNAVLSDQPTSD
ncbi:DNA mismatch endonuclease Vsr [Pseudoclavibacter sp. 8L]|uniref:DNA mismatch endonuclease Vsr n=1 Tax=Pseudoclavibacter sp. 8L TaxID=2653162 RepID=UPI001358302D|nr:DNA mismatch endonuclease Vsr [Pseudoclavibacter sp. 8L]